MLVISFWEIRSQTSTGLYPWTLVGARPDLLLAGPLFRKKGASII